MLVEREREVARFPDWLTQIGLSLPKLEILRTEVRALGADTWRIRFGADETVNFLSDSDPVLAWIGYTANTFH